MNQNDPPPFRNLNLVSRSTRHSTCWRIGVVATTVLAAGILGANLKAQSSLKTTSNNRSIAASFDATAISLRTRILVPVPQDSGALASQPTAGHLILQFESGRLDEGLEELKRRGVRVLEFVPKYAVSAYVPAGTDLSGAGLRWAGPLEDSDKLSANLLDKKGNVSVVVALYHEARSERVRRLIMECGGSIIDNPYLRPENFLVAIDAERLPALSALDEISFVYPASTALVEGRRVHFCPGPLTPQGPVGDFVAHDDGWDGPGLGSALNLTYFFVNGTPDVSGENAEVVRALGVWTQYAQIGFTAANQAGLNRSFDIKWAVGDHGDNSPFDGPHGVLAHCFYPAPPNPETIAGDMHFDEDEDWAVGGDIDIFSVALHEAGHGLGLNHSNDPNAVMYPFYNGVVNDLASDDIAGIRSIYASAEPSGPPNNNFANAQVIGGRSGSAIGSNDGATSEPGEPVHYGVGGGQSIWYRWQAPHSGRVIFDTIGSNFDSVLAVYQGNAVNALTERASNDDAQGLQSRVIFNVTAGSTYRIAIDGYSNASGNTRLNWKLEVGKADFTGDAKSDILWQNTSTGDAYIWLMNGVSYAGNASLGRIATTWRMAGAGDFNGDGKSDILWENTSSGARTIWLMNGVHFASSVSLGTVPTSWRMAGAGDFNGDGKSDILWENTSSGARTIWLMNGVHFASSATLGTVATSWRMAGTGDFNGDAQPDILWENTSSGARSIWLMNGVHFASTVTLGTIPTSMRIAGTGDFNGDAQPDILWQDSATGNSIIWLMDGVFQNSTVNLVTIHVAWRIRNF